MKRKWDIVDLKYVSRIEQASINKSQIIKLAEAGLMQKEISEKLDLSPACVSVTLSRYRKGGV